jgi:hypothetical protein
MKRLLLAALAALALLGGSLSAPKPAEAGGLTIGIGYGYGGFHPGYHPGWHPRPRYYGGPVHVYRPHRHHYRPHHDFRPHYGFYGPRVHHHRPRVRCELVSFQRYSHSRGRYVWSTREVCR